MLREDLCCSDTLAISVVITEIMALSMGYCHEVTLLIINPFTQGTHGSRVLHDYIFCQCLLLLSGINIGFAISVLMGKGWVLLCVKQYCEY